MAISVNNLQSVGASSLSYTPSSVTDSCLVVFVSSEDIGAGEPITGISFGATGMTIQASSTCLVGGNSNDVVMAYLVNPGTSEETITVTGGQSDRVGIVALTLDNVDITSTVDTSSQTAETANLTVLSAASTTTNDNSFILSCGTISNAASALSVTGATEILDFAPPSSRLAVADSTQVSAGSYDHEWTVNTSQRLSVASIAFNLASASGGRIMGSLAGQGGLAGIGGLAGRSGGMAG